MVTVDTEKSMVTIIPHTVPGSFLNIEFLNGYKWRSVESVRSSLLQLTRKAATVVFLKNLPIASGTDLPIILSGGISGTQQIASSSDFKIDAFASHPLSTHNIKLFTYCVKSCLLLDSY